MWCLFDWGSTWALTHTVLWIHNDVNVLVRLEWHDIFGYHSIIWVIKILQGSSYCRDITNYHVMCLFGYHCVNAKPAVFCKRIITWTLNKLLWSCQTVYRCRCLGITLWWHSSPSASVFAAVCYGLSSTSLSGLILQLLRYVWYTPKLIYK